MLGCLQVVLSGWLLSHSVVCEVCYTGVVLKWVVCEPLCYAMALLWVVGLLWLLAEGCSGVAGSLSLFLSLSLSLSLLLHSP